MTNIAQIYVAMYCFYTEPHFSFRIKVEGRNGIGYGPAATLNTSTLSIGEGIIIITNYVFVVDASFLSKKVGQVSNCGSSSSKKTMVAILPYLAGSLIVAIYQRIMSHIYNSAFK